MSQKQFLKIHTKINELSVKMWSVGSSDKTIIDNLSMLAESFFKKEVKYSYVMKMIKNEFNIIKNIEKVKKLEERANKLKDKIQELNNKKEDLIKIRSEKPEEKKKLVFIDDEEVKEDIFNEEVKEDNTKILIQWKA